jgi:hypothetical protein
LQLLESDTHPSGTTSWDYLRCTNVEKSFASSVPPRHERRAKGQVLGLIRTAKTPSVVESHRDRNFRDTNVILGKRSPCSV